MTPVLALLGTDIINEEFNQAVTARVPVFGKLPALLSGLSLITFAVLPGTGLWWTPQLEPWIAIAALLLGAAILWTSLHSLPRWSFVLLILAGMLFGRALVQHNMRAAVGHLTIPALPMWLIPTIAGAAAVAWLIAHFVFQRSHAGEGADEEYLFTGENVHVFFGDGHREKAALSRTIGDEYSFVIFGDVTGAESPLSTRRGGFFIFRSLTRMLADTLPVFAISLGDLASQSTSGAFRRLRKIVKQIPVPMAVTPGNHDLFIKTRYDAANFHSLFGADNAVFQFGPVHFVVLNNARGYITEEQFEWLECALPKEAAPFTLVFCHKPLFDFREDVFYGMETRPHAERLHEMFRQRAVTAVFSGHIHTLLHSNKDGVEYVVSGGAGSKLTSAQDQYHYLNVQVTPSELTIRALPLQMGRIGSDAPLLELRFSARA